jgi:DNA-binding response OmpR family regulator
MHKILLVDDEKSILEMLKYCLEHEGYMVLTAETGKMAQNWVKETKIDLAIVDLGLPDMSGIEVCEAIKEDPRTRSVPIIILTGNTSNEARIKGNLYGHAELFLNKPIEIDDLRKAVACILEKAEKKKLLLRNSFKTRLD